MIGKFEPIAVGRGTNDIGKRLSRHHFRYAVESL
jgi:hypothetical protein